MKTTADIQEVLDLSATKSVANMIDDGCKIVMCEVSEERMLGSKGKIRGVVSFNRCNQGYITSYKDSDGSSWDYAIPINNDGDRMTIYAYKLMRGK